MAGVRAFSLLLWLCIAGSALGRDHAPAAGPLDLADLAAPTFSNFSARDGLPDAVTVAVRTDRDGFVWAATPAGVFRYDGHRWTASDDPGMAHSADSLWLDHRGTLWAGFRNDGLARYDGAHWHIADTRSGLPSQQIRRFTETVDASGATTLWAVTWDRGLMFRRDGRWHADPGNAGLPRGALLSMAQTRELGGRRRQWVGTGNEGLWYRDEDGRGWRQWHAPELDTAQVEYLLATQRAGREELWISVFGAGLWRLSADGLRRWSQDHGELPTNELYDIAATPLPGGDRAIWVASRSGLIRIHDDRVQVFDRGHGLPSDVVRGVSAWRSPGGNDVLWLATEAGIARTVLGASAWSTASLMGARSIGVFGVLVEPDGRGGERLWVGSNNDGLGLYEHGRWRHFTAADGTLPASSVGMVAATRAADGTRTRWLGLRGGELLRMQLGPDGAPRFERVDAPWPRNPGESVLDALSRTVDGREELWFATRQSGIYRLRDGRWTAFRPASVQGQWRVVRLREQRDAGGRSWLWASTGLGLARFDGERWELLGRDAGLPEVEQIGMSLIADRRGRPVLWIGTVSAGIERVDVSDPRHPVLLPDTLPPLPDASAYSALQDSAGRIYVCTNSGVQQLTPDGDDWRARVFTRRDGMVHDECNTNAQFIDAHDRYWTGTLGGLTVYDPHHENHDTQPKPLRITALRVDGKPVAGPALRVGADARTVEVEFALLSWQRESESRFRTQLLGLEPEPGAWSAQSTRSFGALPPGDYRLRVEARDHAGNASAVEVPVTVAAQWWERPLARVAAVLALALLGYGVVRLRTRRLHAQRRMLERRIAARTAELDAANARLVELSYRDALTGLANRRRLLEALEPPPAAGGPAIRTALVFLDVDYFKDYNDRFGHPAGDEALRCVAATLRQCVPGDALVARYGGEEFACLLPGADTGRAADVAEHLRHAVAGLSIPVPGEARPMHVTISAGVASTVLASADDAHRLLRDADRALYQAKREGRNRVCTAAQSMPASA